MKMTNTKRTLRIISTALAMTFAMSSTIACDFTWSAPPNVKAIVNSNGGSPIPEDKCLLLVKNNLALSVVGSASVLNGVNVAWVVVNIQGKGDNVMSDVYGSSTTVNTQIGSQDTANSVFMDVYEKAIDSLDFNKGIAEVFKYRKIAKSK